MVGNVGVIGIAPPSLIPSEKALETGAYKVTGFSKLLFPYNLSQALDNFVSVVINGRGDRLKLSSTQIRRGMIYFGSEAVTAGLADAIGSLQKAIDRAAQEAKLSKYDVVDLTQINPQRFAPVSSANWTSVTLPNLTLNDLCSMRQPPAMYYIYLPLESYTQTLPPASNQTVDISMGNPNNARVLVDNSHRNQISWWDLDMLMWELVKRDMTVQFVSEWDALESALDNASTLIVASPTDTYSVEESEKIEAFVNKGGLLLLLFDPAYEYVEIPTLFGPINSLSTRFGLSFAKGYLYNEGEYYGIYRNIYVHNFSETSVTQNLTSILLLTATHIHAQDKGVAWTAENTYSSAAERTQQYSVIALTENNGTVMAFSDLTFLREPYCYLEDNYQLIRNLASTIVNVQVPAIPSFP
jgi:hypothetical protein